MTWNSQAAGSSFSAAAPLAPLINPTPTFSEAIQPAMPISTKGFPLPHPYGSVPPGVGLPSEVVIRALTAPGPSVFPRPGNVQAELLESRDTESSGDQRSQDVLSERPIFGGLSVSHLTSTETTGSAGSEKGRETPLSGVARGRITRADSGMRRRARRMRFRSASSTPSTAVSTAALQEGQGEGSAEVESSMPEERTGESSHFGDPMDPSSTQTEKSGRQ